MVFRNDNTKSRSCSCNGIRKYSAIVIFSDLFAHGKTNSGSAILGFTMKSLKDVEYLFCMGLIKADTIVLNIYFPISAGYSTM